MRFVVCLSREGYWEAALHRYVDRLVWATVALVLIGFLASLP